MEFCGDSAVELHGQEAKRVLYSASFGEENFGNVRLGDERRTRRLVQTADAIMAHPGGSLPQKVGDPARLKGLYRLMKNEEVTHDAVIAEHCRQVIEKMRACPGVVLLIQDPTELDYTSKKSLTDLGHVGRGKGRGYFCHHLLALEAQDRQVIGLGAQVLHKRATKRGGESRAAQRQRLNKESRLWQQCREAVGEAPATSTWVDITDRGGDIFEFLEQELSRGRHFVVRSKYDRKLAFSTKARGAEPCLHAFARGLADLGQKTLTVPSAKGRPPREAQVRIAAGRVPVS